MSQTTAIQWTDATWNIARGCTKVDADCKFCYMYRDSFNGTRYVPKNVVRTKTVFNLPLRLKEPSKIFTCSLTDFFHEAIDSYRHEAWDIIRQCPHHTFQILTKRPERITQCLPPDWGEGWANVWLGTSVGSQSSSHRIATLCEVKANVRFLSMEPLYEHVFLDLGNFCDGLAQKRYERIHWIIAGGESGNETGKYRYRPCELEWIEWLIHTGRNFDIPVFVKQLGTHLAKELGLKNRHGGDITEWPEHLQVRQFPNL